MSSHFVAAIDTMGRAAHVWDADTGTQIAELNNGASEVASLAFSADGHWLATSSDDGVRVFDTSTWKQAVMTAGPPIGVECDTGESLEPDQRFIALSCRNHGTRVWDTARGDLLAELPGVTNVEGDYFSASPAVTATGDRAAIARGNTVKVYAVPGGQLVRTIAHSAAVNAVAFAPAGHDLVSGAVDGSLLITRDDRDPIALPASPAGIDAAAILADGRVVAADASHRLRVIAPDRTALLMDLAAPSCVRLLRPSSDGARLITISIRSEQASPALWDLDQHRLVVQLDGHVGRVFTARFVAAGREILTAGADGTLMFALSANERAFGSQPEGWSEDADQPSSLKRGSGQARCAGRSCSTRRASLSTPTSSKRRPTICTPIGRPSRLAVQLTDAAGCSDML